MGKYDLVDKLKLNQKDPNKQGKSNIFFNSYTITGFDLKAINNFYNDSNTEKSKINNINNKIKK